MLGMQPIAADRFLNQQFRPVLRDEYRPVFAEEIPGLEFFHDSPVLDAKQRTPFNDIDKFLIKRAE